MKRAVDLKDISDGKLYDNNDMVKADCFGCVGCHKCCTGMGESIVLDPFDVFNLTAGTGKSFEQLLEAELEMNIVDGLTLPNINMKNGKCSFLREGRCCVHDFRPGICRMFPLGRYYNEEGFKYFLQVHECPVNNKGKIKVKKWIGYQNINEYEEYIKTWHGFLVKLQDNLSQLSEENIKVLNLLLIKTFYQTNYGDDFFRNFYERIKQTNTLLGISQAVE